MYLKSLFVFLALFFVSTLSYNIKHANIIGDVKPDATFQLGVGKVDITGPAAEAGMMGYAMPQQITAGLHTRLWARAYVFVDGSGNRVAFVNLDLCMTMQAVKLVVIEKLKAVFGPNTYTQDNVMLTGIHTHSGPGGYSWYALYDITTFGFHKENFDFIVDGIVAAITRAHRSVKNGNLAINVGQLFDSNINRSPSSYLANPESERKMYPEGDTDKNMTIVKLSDGNGNDMGVITWFAVHCTSMNNTNKLISADNKGYAEYLFERYKNGNFTRFSDGAFVASFAQTNEGDVSPNTRGAKCPDGRSCAMNSSTCNGKNEECIAAGPGVDMFDSTRIIGLNQFNKAVSLFKAANVTISGNIAYRHMFINISDMSVSGEYTHDGKPSKTCRAAMGYSFAAGTTDGPGAFDFTQGDNNTNGNPFWNFISSFLAKPTKEQIECQAPKPILLDVGLTQPYPWVPDVVPVQMFSIGQLVILAVPAEFTTMAGRRLRNVVRGIYEAAGMKDRYIVITGLANTYTGYVTTYEEYVVQRYEAASTVFGPNTLGAYTQSFVQMTNSIIKGVPVPAGPYPRNLSDHQMNFEPPVILDSGSFGKVHTDVMKSYRINDTVTVVFYGASPRNNLFTNSPFLTVERLQGGQWQVMLDDADWDTRFHWQRHEIAESLVTITWDITPSIPPGQYRIQTFGYAKPLIGKLHPYTGTSSTFTVTA